VIVFNLFCPQAHHFDGWFRSSDDFLRQSQKGLVACPICGDGEITKALSAPRINTGATQPQLPQHQPAPANANQTSDNFSSPRQGVVDASTEKSKDSNADNAMPPAMQSHMLKQIKAFVLTNTENVGNQFAETARKMHYGEEAHRNIRGRVSRAESLELQEEGIHTIGLPPGVLIDEGVQ